MSNKTQFKKTVEDAFNQWGDKARAVVRLAWSKYDGHFITVRKANGRLLYEDPQSCASVLIDATLKKCTNATDAMWIMRVDNRELSDAVSDAVKSIGDKND